MAEKNLKTIRIKWVRSGIGSTFHQKTIVRSMGLKKLNQTVVRPDTPQIRGIVAAVPHMLEIVPQSEAPAWASIPEYTVHAPEVAPAAPAETAPAAAPEATDEAVGAAETASTPAVTAEAAGEAMEAEEAAEKSHPAPKAKTSKAKSAKAAKGKSVKAEKGKSAKAGKGKSTKPDVKKGKKA